MEITPISNSGEEPEIHRAGWVVLDSEHVLENGFVKIESGIISEVGKWHKKIDGRLIDHGPGVIIPSLVNAHTHLELSALKGQLPFGQAFSQWVGKLLYLREKAGEKLLKDGVKDGISELINSACFVAGEIATLGTFEEDFRKSSIEGVYFREYLGALSEKGIELNPNDTIIKSFAGHAPHTTSPELLIYLKKICQKKGLPFSIHLAESEEEVEFIKTGHGSWANFLKQRNIDFSSWPVNEKGPVAYLDSLGLLDEKTIAVHLIRAEKHDYEILKNKNVQLCLCLRSNENLHKTLPDVLKFFNAKIPLCLGTDSLASTRSLSIFDEMHFMRKKYPEIPPESIFKMATENGAKALGIFDKFGTIENGKTGKIFYLPVNFSKASELFEGLTGISYD